MEKKVKTVCIIVGFLGLLAAALGFAAEAKRIKKNQIHYTPPECIYPGSPALALGLTAAVALMIAQTIISVTTGCLCCRRGPYQINRTVSLVCSTLSWFTFVIAVLLLLFGAALNDGEETTDSTYFGNYYCPVVKPGVFAVAAILSLATVVLGILSYIMVESAKIRGDPWARPTAPGQPGIAMGQPQPQQRSQDPVFVHEDTYMRRQIA